MGRGKIEIKRIENPTNRQVTYSKRRAGIVKKAKELNVLCDAEVCLIMFSSTGKCTDYTSPNTTMKKLFQKYQQISGRDVWKSHYQQMQDTLNKLKETNTKLRKQIGQRVGEDLDDLSIDELRGLEQNLDSSLKTVIQRKFNLIATQTETCRKKIKNLEEVNASLIQEYEERIDDAFTLANHEGISALEMGNGGSNIFCFRLQPSLEDGAYGLHDLRLA
uniref:MADS transcription factor AP3-1 n=1 Tax=Delphinium anthriscifolium TaxID=215072 RepID=A0A977THX4_9MAGN|nr:MADS transcription factor AP3-1 [Delphinium anthriscifolium]